MKNKIKLQMSYYRRLLKKEIIIKNQVEFLIFIKVHCYILFIKHNRQVKQSIRHT